MTGKDFIKIILVLYGFYNKIKITYNNKLTYPEYEIYAETDSGKKYYDVCSEGLLAAISNILRYMGQLGIIADDNYFLGSTNISIKDILNDYKFKSLLIENEKEQ